MPSIFPSICEQNGILTGKLDVNGTLQGNLTPTKSHTHLETVTVYFMAEFVSNHRAQLLAIGMLWM